MLTHSENRNIIVSMRTFADAGVSFEAPQVVVPDITREDPTALAVATYTNLGRITDQGRATEQFGEMITDLTKALPDSIRDRPHYITVVPRLGQAGLAKLHDAYNALTGTHGNDSTEVWPDLWDQFDDEVLAGGQVADLEARAVLLDAPNEYGEPGLYFTRQRIGEQRHSITAFNEVHDDATTAVHSTGPASYLIQNAAKLSLSEVEPLLDRRTFTRFPELEGGVDGVPRVGSADSLDGRLYFCVSYVFANPRVGVRLEVGQKPEAPNA